MLFISFWFVHFVMPWEYPYKILPLDLQNLNLKRCHLENETLIVRTKLQFRYLLCMSTLKTGKAFSTILLVLSQTYTCYSSEPCWYIQRSCTDEVWMCLLFCLVACLFKNLNAYHTHRHSLNLINLLYLVQNSTSYSRKSLAKRCLCPNLLVSKARIKVVFLLDFTPPPFPPPPPPPPMYFLFVCALCCIYSRNVNKERYNNNYNWKFMTYICVCECASVCVCVLGGTGHCFALPYPCFCHNVCKPWKPVKWLG